MLAITLTKVAAKEAQGLKLLEDCEAQFEQIANLVQP